MPYPSSFRGALALWLFWSIALCALPANAQDPASQHILGLTTQTSGDIHSLGLAAELLPRLEALSQPKREAALARALKARPHPLARALLERQRALWLLDQGRKQEADALIQQQGFVTRWQVAGPFDNETGEGLDQAYGPESSQELAQPMPGRHGAVQWRPLEGRDFLGVVDLEALVRPSAGSVAYAMVALRSPRAQKAVLRVGADAPYKLWLGGQQVARVQEDPGGDIDRDAWGVQLKKGDNLILLKLANASEAFTFSLRLTDAQGAPLKGIQAVEDPKALQAALPAPSQGGQPFGAAPHEGAFAVQAPAALLRQAAEATPDTQPERKALALARAAALLKRQRPRDTNEPWLELLQQARELSPRADTLLLASDTYQAQWRKRDAIEQAHQRQPQDPWIRYQRASILYESAGDVHVTEAISELEALMKEHPDFVAPRLRRVQLYQDEGLQQAAFALAQQTSQQHPEHPEALRVTFATASEALHPDALGPLCQQQQKVEASRIGIYGTCASVMLKLGDKQEARALVQRGLQMRPDITGFWGLAADIEVALGDPAAATAALERLTTLLPDDPNSWYRLGAHLAEHGDKKRAIEAFTRALEIAPQNAELQSYLAHLKPSEPGFEEAYVLAAQPLDPEQEQARYSTEDYYYLVDQQVTRVFPNGLSSRFVQQVVKVRTDPGVSEMRDIQISYTPGEERVDVGKVRITRQDGSIRESYSVFEQSLSEPWYNLYYDYRAMILSIPDLEKGDTVEVQYKVTQTSAQNYLGDYFGDIWFVQDTAPKEVARYTLLTDPDKQILDRAPTLAGCSHEEDQQQVGPDTLKRRAWTCRQVPGVDNEPSRPGFSQVADYLHLSTWEDWGGLARWYWELIKDQLVVDAEIRQLVAQLTQGLTEDRQKVSAIHNYVVKNTRYVGLEFGIHGFKPYRTTQCLRRRFGDCKDKASLLKVMLETAGVPANLVLIRTRNNGAIDAQPPSLQIFDHAITYVPGFDLFLDGTAEYSGTRELPWGDQGAQVLIVKNGGGFQVRQTPVLDAKHNAILTTSAVDLRQETARVDASTVVTGDFAASYRRAYETEQSRQDLFGRQLTRDYPGARVTWLQFGDLADLEQDVKLAYRYEIPSLGQRDAKTLRVLPALRPANLSQRLAPWPKRDQPLELGHPYLNHEVYQITLPRGAQPERALRDVSLSSDFGTFALSLRWKAQSNTEPPVLTVEMKLEMKRHTVTAQEYPALRAWLGEIDQALGTDLVFVRK